MFQLAGVASVCCKLQVAQLCTLEYSVMNTLWLQRCRMAAVLSCRSQYSILNNISSTKQHSIQLASEKSIFVSINALKCSVLRGSSLLQVQMPGAVPRVELQRCISDGVMGQFSFSRPALTIHFSKCTIHVFRRIYMQQSLSATAKFSYSDKMQAFWEKTQIQTLTLTLTAPLQFFGKMVSHL